ILPPPAPANREGCGCGSGCRGGCRISCCCCCCGCCCDCDCACCDNNGGLPEDCLIGKLALWLPPVLVPRPGPDPPLLLLMKPLLPPPPLLLFPMLAPLLLLLPFQLAIPDVPPVERLRREGEELRKGLPDDDATSTDPAPLVGETPLGFSNPARTTFPAPAAPAPPPPAAAAAPPNPPTTPPPIPPPVQLLAALCAPIPSPGPPS
ncbi:unnamed protein product, partial [Closterium sp. NIES-54]